MASEKDANREGESNPDDAGPGAAVDEALEQETGALPGERAQGTVHAVPAAKDHEEHEEHEPSEHSYWPILVAASVLVIGIGFLWNLVVTAVGAVLLLAAIVGWFREPWVS